MFGNVRDVKPMQPSKAPTPILVIEPGIIVLLHPIINSFVEVSIIALQSLRESYTLFPDSTTICPNLEQLLNAPMPIDVTELGMIIEDRSEQPSKAHLPIDVIEFGMTIEANPVQPPKAYSPIDETELGMIAEVSPVCPLKAQESIATTEFGIIVLLQPAINLFVAVSIIALQLPRESYALLSGSTSILFNPLQP